jgi:hypothetical protein
LLFQFSVVQLSAFLAEADEAEWLDEQELVPTEIDGEPGTSDERQLDAWPGRDSRSFLTCQNFLRSLRNLLISAFAEFLLPDVKKFKTIEAYVDHVRQLAFSSGFQPVMHGSKRFENGLATFVCFLTLHLTKYRSAFGDSHVLPPWWTCDDPARSPRRY